MPGHDAKAVFCAPVLLVLCSFVFACVDGRGAISVLAIKGNEWGTLHARICISGAGCTDNRDG